MTVVLFVIWGILSVLIQNNLFKGKNIIVPIYIITTILFIASLIFTMYSNNILS